MQHNDRPVLSVMLAVPDASAAMVWYQQALGATILWDLGGVVGLEIAGAPFFLGEPANNGWESPIKLGITSTRVEVFCDDPDALIARAVEAGANGSIDRIRHHQMPWGPHRQGGFVDPFGHIWLVGDRSPLSRHLE
jgi:PhnB protein